MTTAPTPVQSADRTWDIAASFDSVIDDTLTFQQQLARLLQLDLQQWPDHFLYNQEQLATLNQVVENNGADCFHHLPYYCSEPEKRYIANVLSRFADLVSMHRRHG